MARNDRQRRTAEGERDGSAENRFFSRRSVLKATGALGVAAASSLGIGNAAAADSTAGFGEGDYGADQYGTGETTTTTSFGVSTVQATDVQTTSATLNGSVADLGGADTADIAFEYRPVGGSWSTTASQTLSAAQTFSQSVSGLNSGTDYECRATGLSSSGETATGSTVAFTTVAETTESPPAINRFNVSEAGRKDPHAEVTVNWDATDVDGDLASVVLEVADSSGTTLRSTAWTFDGTAAASDTDEYRFKKGGGVDYQVTMTVTDQAGNTVSQQTMVSA
jgi:subtilisin